MYTHRFNTVGYTVSQQKEGRRDLRNIFLTQRGRISPSLKLLSRASRVPRIWWDSRSSMDLSLERTPLSSTFPTSWWSCPAFLSLFLWCCCSTDHTVQDGWCHYREVKDPQEWSSHSKRPLPPLQEEVILAPPVQGVCVMSPVQFIVQVNTRVLVRVHSLNVLPLDVHWCERGGVESAEIHQHLLVFSALRRRWFLWHQSTKSCSSPLYSASSKSVMNPMMWELSENCCRIQLNRKDPKTVPCGATTLPDAHKLGPLCEVVQNPLCQVVVYHHSSWSLGALAGWCWRCWRNRKKRSSHHSQASPGDGGSDVAGGW